MSIEETIDYIMENGLDNCEGCGEFVKEHELMSGVCEACLDEEELCL